MQEKAMEAAILSAKEGIQKGEGGPFGASIVHKNQIIAVAHNEVLKNNDPTCHAEMNAIRQAAAYLSTYNLSECEIYVTAEPCPMCLAAIYWARIKCIHIGVKKDMAAVYGFDDAVFYEEVLKSSQDRQVKEYFGVLETECKKVFAEWKTLNLPLY